MGQVDEFTLFNLKVFRKQSVAFIRVLTGNFFSEIQLKEPPPEVKKKNKPEVKWRSLIWP